MINNPFTYNVTGDDRIYRILDNMSKEAWKEAMAADVFQACCEVMSEMADDPIPFKLSAAWFRCIDKTNYRKSLPNDELVVCYKNSKDSIWHSHILCIDVYSPMYGEITKEFTSMDEMFKWLTGNQE